MGICWRSYGAARTTRDSDVGAMGERVHDDNNEGALEGLGMDKMTTVQRLDRKGRFFIHPDGGDIYIFAQQNNITRWAPTAGGSDCFEVFAKCHEKSHRIGTERHINGEIEVYNGTFSARAPTLPLAICRFARKLFSQREGGG